MLFYSPYADTKLSQFGIQVPLADERSFKIKEWAVSNGLGSRLVELSTEPLAREVITLAHEESLATDLYGEKRESILRECYELFDESGRPYRYRPDLATEPLGHLADRLLHMATATCETINHSLDLGFAFHLGGGMHHAMSFAPRGFCLVNDIVLGLK